jgi:hypothetical protein
MLIFSMVLRDREVFRMWSPSGATPIDSWIWRPSKKPNCSFEIVPERMGFSLLAIILAMIL